MCMQLIIIVFFYDKLNINKFISSTKKKKKTNLFNNYAIIYVKPSSKPSYIKHYNIIRISHGQLTSY